MDDKEKYGVALAAGGMLLWIGGYEIGFVELSYIGLVPFVIGGLLLYSAWMKWYCAACGQFLGRGDKPRRCDRCGSNRVTNEDPGAVR
ncbi:hypothetical protein [Haloarchaeobius sp. HRN-SO-5]|uniref:hypothetical protein n=1 Tax=Haloarchaeobius sp. HRN-SO-5 TaxID=3446118 RepID=UPI003EC0FA93